MIINMTGGSGGGSGASLTVNSANAGTVTVSNSTLGKSYARTVSAGGSVVFKGLATGTWTVTLSASGQTPSTKTVNIIADYATSIAFFTASIVITYPANSSLTVKDSGGNTVATDTNATATTKTYTATVSAAGTYTITATATDGSGNSSSGTAVISSDGQSVSVTLSYWDGSLYDNGNEYESITGGWKGYPFTYSGQTYSSPTVTKNATNIQLSVTGNGGAASFANKLNLDGFSTLNINFTSNNFGSNRLFLYLAAEREQNPIATIGIGGQTGVVSLSFDPATLSGDVYIGIGGYAAIGISYSAVFDKMWLS